MFQLLGESIIVGLVELLVGELVFLIISKVTKSPLPEVCQTWNDNYVMEISLLITGICVHLLTELVGLNKLYCTSRYACISH